MRAAPYVTLTARLPPHPMGDVHVMSVSVVTAQRLAV